MPVTLHGDLIFINYFPSFLSLHGVWDIYGYFGNTYLDRGFTYYHPLVYLTVGFFQWIVLPLNPGFANFAEHVHRLMSAGNGPALLEYLKPFSGTERMRFVFFMKTPYLFFDLAILVAIQKIFIGETEKRSLTLLWLFNPVNLLSTYVIGQYRILGAFLVWLLMGFLVHHRRREAFLTLGFLCLVDNFPVFIAPLLFILYSRNIRECLKNICWTAAPLLAVLAPWVVVSKGYVLYAYASPVIQRMSMQGILKSLPVESAVGAKMIFLAFYGYLLFFLVRLKKKKTEETLDFFFIFVATSLAVLFMLFATSLILFHYLMWVLPFWVVWERRQKQHKLFWPLLLLALLMLFTLDTRSLNAELLSPINPVFFSSLPSWHQAADRWVPWGKVVALSRLAFSFLSVFFALRLLSEIGKTDRHHLSIDGRF